MGTLKLLHQAGASLRMENRRGDLPLHEAVAAGNTGSPTHTSRSLTGKVALGTELVRWLLAVHPDTAGQGNHEGRTGLHLAAAAGDVEMAELLLSRGADPNPLMLYKGELVTPLELARAKGEAGAEAALKGAGAVVAEAVPESVRRAARSALTAAVARAASERAVAAAADSSPPATTTSEDGSGKSSEKENREQDKAEGKVEKRKSRKGSKKRREKAASQPRDSVQVPSPTTLSGKMARGAAE